MTKTILSTLLLVCSSSALQPAFAAPLGELTMNGGFEAGDTSSWAYFPTPSSTFDVTNDANSGAFAGNVFNDTLASAAVIKQANLGVGLVNPGATVEISFAAKGVGAVAG